MPQVIADLASQLRIATFRNFAESWTKHRNKQCHLASCSQWRSWPWCGNIPPTTVKNVNWRESVVSSRNSLLLHTVGHSNTSELFHCPQPAFMFAALTIETSCQEASVRRHPRHQKAKHLLYQVYSFHTCCLASLASRHASIAVILNSRVSQL